LWEQTKITGKKEIEPISHYSWTSYKSRKQRITVGGECGGECRRVNIDNTNTVHMHVNGKMIPVETIPEMGLLGK
jgi:hypothetical protein